MHRTARLSAAILAAALLAPATAAAAPTLIAPTPDSLKDSRPLFSWTVPPGEVVNSVAVANKPDVTPEGEFFSENRKDFGVPAEGATSYQDTYRLAAGNYWWMVNYKVTEPFAYLNTAPTPFTIPAYVRGVQNKVTQYTYVADWFDVSYVANGPTARTSCAIFHGRKRIGLKTSFDAYVRVGERDSTYCQIKVGPAYAGKRLKLVTTVKSGTATASKVTWFVGKRR